jgi:WXG100 family type VII secretion target
MARIKISPDQVRNVASQFRQKSQESGTMASQLQSAVKGMESEWEGMAAQRFYGDYTAWNQQMQKYVELLSSIATELDRIANTIEQTDQQLAGK